MENDSMTDALIECEVCLKEIPQTVGDNAEADEYVSHYCGLECYQRWQETKKPD